MKTALRDSVGDYLQEIGPIPMLTPEQEIVLGRKVQKFNSLLSTKEKFKAQLGRQPTRLEWAERANCSISMLAQHLGEGNRAKNQLIVANLRLVVSVAKKYLYRGLDFLDLILEGNTGLIIAAERFKPKKGCRFSTFAHWWIRQAIVRAIQNNSKTIRLPCYIHEKVQKIKKITRQMAIKIGRTPTISEIAPRVQIPPEKIRFYLKASQSPASLDQKLEVEEEAKLLDLVPNNSPLPIELLVKQELFCKLSVELFESLNQQEREILNLRYGFTSKPQSLEKKLLPN